MCGYIGYDAWCKHEYCLLTRNPGQTVLRPNVTLVAAVGCGSQFQNKVSLEEDEDYELCVSA